jgi:hypothetical protein
LRAGIDIKSDGGYIVVPYSRHKSGNLYQWAEGLALKNVALAQAPEWLLSLITESNRPGWDGQRADVCADDLCFPEGTRENSLVSLIGSMNRRGMSRESILAAMREENRLKSKPCLPDDEVENIVDKQLEQYSPDPSSIVGVPQDTYEPVGWPPRAALEGVTSPDAGRVEEIISSLLGRGTTTILAATWKSGKTLLTYRLILDALMGKPVYGVLHTIQPLKVMMLQFEMPLPEDERRYRRLAIGAELNPDMVTQFSATGRLYHYSRPPINLTDPVDLKRFHSLVFGGGFDLVIVDSVTAAFTGIDMNDNTRVRKLYQDTFLPLTTNGVSVLLLHHKRKGSPRRKGDPPDDPKNTLLGAQAWGAASDRIFLLEPVADAEGGKEPGSFKVRLSLAGGWAPSGFEKMVLHIYDNGDGTCIEPVADEALTALTKTEQAAKDLYRYVTEHRLVTWPNLQTYLKEQMYSRNEMFKARDLALQRGWIDPAPRLKATDPISYITTIQPVGK